MSEAEHATVRIRDIEDFIQGYLEAAVFTGAERKDGDPLKDSDKDYDWTLDDLDEEDHQSLRANAAVWCARHRHIILAAEETGEVHLGGANGVFALAGHDFWMTRNHHGVGFWDGDWPEPYATKLTLASHAMTEVDLFVDVDDIVRLL